MAECKSRNSAAKGHVSADAENVVQVPWLEWHNTREELKEARRLLKLATEAGRKGDAIDVEQIEGFLR